MIYPPELRPVLLEHGTDRWAAPGCVSSSRWPSGWSSISAMESGAVRCAENRSGGRGRCHGTRARTPPTRPLPWRTIRLPSQTSPARHASEFPLRRLARAASAPSPGIRSPSTLSPRDGDNVMCLHCGRIDNPIDELCDRRACRRQQHQRSLLDPQSFGVVPDATGSSHALLGACMGSHWSLTQQPATARGGAHRMAFRIAGSRDTQHRAPRRHNR
ncbi:hypothetical protein OKW43_008232 [Paraburkholderia sp. WC7.3g]